MKNKWKEWIKQFPKLDECWSQLPEPVKTLLAWQIDGFAESENQKLREENERLRIISDNLKKENKEIKNNHKSEINALKNSNTRLQSKIKDLEENVIETARKAWNASYYYNNSSSREDFEEFMKQQGL